MMGDPSKKDPDSPESPAASNNADDEDQIDEDDLHEVLDVDDNEEDAMAAGVDDMDMDNDDDTSESFIPPRDDATYVYSAHSGSVFCAALDPSSHSMVATGGEDDKAYVFKSDTGEILLKCEGHKDSVTCVGFSADSTHLATGDMSGLIQLWNMDKKSCVWSFEVSDLEWLKWHSAAPVLLAGTSDGDVWMWKMPSGDCKTFQGHGAACNVGEIFPDGKRSCCAYDDGSIKIWDLKSGLQTHHFTGQSAHMKAVTAIDCHHDNGIVMSGSLDGTAKILNSVNGKVITTYNCATSESMDGEEDSEDSVEAVGFSPSHPFAATGTLSGTLCIWDINKNIQRSLCKHDAGIVRLKWHSAVPLVYTCTLDGIIHLWDSRTGKLERQWFGHSAEILDMELSSDNSIVLTASGDSTARLYKMDS